MTLINCSVCEQKISENAYVCPHCGDHIKDHPATVLAHSINTVSKKRMKFFWIFYIFFVLLIIYLSMGLISHF